MPLPSSGIIVVDKTSVIAASGTTPTLTNNKSNLQQFYEFYDVNEGSVGNIINEPNNNNNGGSNSNCNNNPLMRRHQRTISSSSSSSTHSPSSTSIQQQQHQIKHHQVVTTNLQTLGYNQQQQQHQQQQMNQQQHHQQTATTHHVGGSSSSGGGTQQLIVSEEYIEHAQSTGNNSTGGTSNGNVMISTTNEVLNQQIIKIVTADVTTGNMIIDSMGHLTPSNGSGGNGNNGTSKVLYNNVTVLSKQANAAGPGGVAASSGQLTQQQHHQQTINFVNAKSLPYITTTSKSQTTNVQKVTTYKGTNVAIKQANSAQQHHVLSTASGHTVIGQQQGQPQQQVVQKVTMPRNVQMVTRVQTLVAPQHSPQQQQQHVSAQHANTGQMVMQQKYVHNIVTTGGAVGAGKTNLIKKSTGQSMKLQQHKIISTQQQQGVKTFIQQQSGGGGGQQQHYQTINIHQGQHQTSATVVPQTTLKHVKSQKIIKQYNNAITNNSGAVSVATLHQNHSNNASSVATSGTYTISNKINNVSGAGVHQQHHLSTKLTKHPKYVMQNHIVIPSSSNASSQNQNHKVNSNSGNSIMVNQQILNTINSCNNSSGTIKFVNAHGTVIQQQQQQQQAPTIITTTQKVRTNSGSSGGSSANHQYQQSQQVHITQQQFVTADGGKSDGNNIYHISPATGGGYIQSGGPQQNAQQNSPLHTDDIMIVNGTQMTDELSARILQSMAQKSFNNQQRFHQQQPVTTAKIIHQSGSMPPPAQMSVQQQQHHTTTSNLILSSKEYPIYNVQQQQYQQQPQRLGNSAPNSRSQSLERKYHDTTISTKKSATEYYKVKNDGVGNQQQMHQQQQSTTMAMASRIPVGTTLTQHHHHQQQQQHHHPQQHQQSSTQQSSTSADQDEELIGEEVRPVPVNTNDLRLQVLQAVLQDHTYVVAMPTRFPIEMPSTSPAIASNNSQQQQSQTTIATSIATTLTHNTGHSRAANDTKVIYSTSNPMVVSSSNSQSQLSMINVSAQNNQHSSGGPSTTTSYTIYGHQIARPQQDDDAHSAISSGSTRATGPHGDIDPGEETETAPEAEAEDDSITRCICDLTHDDGYMICCDKCSAWQHVDCMGIDRQNIPDEYLCELCQPREVDRARARSLQLLKRKEQTQMLLNAAQLNAAGTTVLVQGDAVNGATGSLPQQQLGGLPSVVSSVPPQLTKKGKLIKRKELVKKTKKEKAPGTGAAAKRRETKKTTKRKSKSGTGDPVDKYAANLRQWIENYELAVTNHYSPELRARLHAISKQPNLLHSITATENKALKHCGSLENKATTVPHAGGKILISNFDIAPNSPIFELRGKYMLTTQYKTQNASINMNSPPPSNYLQTLKSHKIPGAFIFFYQLPGDGGQGGPEICVDTRTYGNEARFVRRSCRPNAVIQHLFEKGTIHLYIVSLTNIMASTEITIKHEPHDLLALENKKQFSFAIQPTSTNCACGLTKDCLFGVLPPLAPAAAPTKPVRSNSKVVLNGCVEKGLTPAASKKKAQNINRGRSTSSSGDSNAGLLSPNNNNNSFAPNHLYNSTTSITSLMHDSGVYTSSSSPSVSIPSPPTAQISSPPVQPMPMHIHLPQQLQHQQLVSQAIQHVTHVRITSPSPQPQPATVAQLQQQINTLPAPLILPSQVATETAAIAASMLVQQQALQEIQSAAAASAAAVDETVVPAAITPTPLPTPIQIHQDAKLEEAPPPQQQMVNTVEAVLEAPPTDLLPPPPQDVVSDEVPNAVAIEPIPMVVASCSGQQLQNIACQPQQNALLVENPLPEAPYPPAGGGSPVKSPQKTSSGRKTPAKQARTSVSEDSSNSAQQQQQPPTPTTPTPPKQEEKRESRKLTREERKMEAILRAFEKMEKNQQRKQELKQAKTDVSKRRNSNSPSPKRSNSTDSGAPVNSALQSAKKNASSMRKKKRKSHKSYNITSSSQRKRRKSRMNSNDSDGAATSEESTSMLSPPIQGLQNCLPPGGIPTPESVANRQSHLMSQLMDGEEQQQPLQLANEQELLRIDQRPTDANVDAAAGLLLAFANPEKEANTSQDSSCMEDSIKTPEKADVSGESQTISPPPTPTIVSSTCLLIEAAVGPFENLAESGGSSTSSEFKYPAKTKTKKVLMSNWLNQSSDFHPSSENMHAMAEHQGAMTSADGHGESVVQQQPQTLTPVIPAGPSVGLDSLVQAAMCDYGQARVASPSYMSHGPPAVDICEEPQNLSIVAKKVEEFIHQSEGNATTEQKTLLPVVCQRSSLTLPLQVSTCSNNSSVKKRWLRQAISEETDESSTTTPSSASPQLLNGFATPLKKRRLVINSNDPNATAPGIAEDCTPEDLSRFGSMTDMNEPIKQEDDNDFKGEFKQEALDMDDDVDILRSPSPGQKMVAEDNLVKIEPEDMSGGDDVKIDVEREESREGGGEKFEYKEEPKEEQPECSHPVILDAKKEEIIALKHEDETQEHVEVVDPIKYEDESISVANEPLSDTEMVKEEPKLKIEPVEKMFTPPPEELASQIDLQKVKTEAVSLRPPAKNAKAEETARKRSKHEEKLASKQRKSSSSSTPPIAVKFDSTAENDIPDELADIQERLHSFHKENIMILQSRNKKSKSPKHSSSSSSNKLTSRSSLPDSQKKKTSKKPKKDRKSPKAKPEEGSTPSLSKSKSTKKSSSSSTSEKEKNRHRTSSSSSSSSSKKRQLNFEHIDRVTGSHNHKRSNSTSSSKDECSSAKKRRESSRSEESQKSSSSLGKSLQQSLTSLELLPLQEQAKVALPLPPPPPPPHSAAAALPMCAPVAPINSLPIDDSDKHLHHAAMTIPCFNNTTVNAMPIAGYVVSNSAMPLPPATQGYDMQTLMKVPPAAVSGQAMTSTATTPSGHHLPYYNTIYGKLMDTPTTPVEAVAAITTPTTPTTPTPNLMLSDYLDTKAKSFSSLGGYSTHSTLFGSINSVKPVTTSPLVANGEMTPVPTTPPAAALGETSPISECNSTRLQTTPLKILTKTASHDPRLNPILTAPEPPPAPKRKLSINEYRKRKQQSTDSNIGSPECGDASLSTPTTPAIKSGSHQCSTAGASENAFDKAFDDCERRNSCSNSTGKIDDTPKVQFSPAPTLLEKQQESISERLKSLKSKQASAAVASLKLSSFLGSAASALHGSSNHLGLHKDEFISSTLNRSNSDLDNCLESISSSSTSLASSRESTPEPREHSTHLSYNSSANKTNLSSSSSVSTASTTSLTPATNTATTSKPTPTTASETCLPYSPILDTSADNFDSPIAESIELKKAGAILSSPSQQQQKKNVSDEEVTTPQGKRE